MAKLLGTDEVPPIADARPPLSMGTPLAALLAVAILAATVLLTPGASRGRGDRVARYRSNASKTRYAWSYVEPHEAQWAEQEAEERGERWPELPDEATLRQIVAFVKETGVTVMGYDEQATFVVEADGLHGADVVVRREARAHARGTKVAVHAARRR